MENNDKIIPCISFQVKFQVVFADKSHKGAFILFNGNKKDAFEK